MKETSKKKKRSGDNSTEVTPVPIPNTEVKLCSADDTWRATAWESRTLPVCITSTKRTGFVNYISTLSGDNSTKDTPVSIPNTEVKLCNADDTWWATAWESRKLPVIEALWSSG